MKHVIGQPLFSTEDPVLAIVVASSQDNLKVVRSGHKFIVRQDFNEDVVDMLFLDEDRLIRFCHDTEQGPIS